MAKGKILLIEDDETLVRMYQKKLELDGFQIDIAYDGIEGLQKATDTQPDLVLLDIMLPKLDGLALFKKMRSQTKTFNTPVILLTNLGQEDTVLECYKLGAVDYMVKSDVTPGQVVAKIESFLKERNSSPAPEAPKVS